MQRQQGRRWSVVLSGGDGERMQPFISRWLGYRRPKQYCAFTGKKTMLEHTLARAEAACGCERVVTIVNSGHRQFLPKRAELPGRLIVQPRRCDTAPGVFLPLTYILAEDPEAVVAVMPSDHFIHPRERFLGLLEEAFCLAERLPGQAVLVAAQPDGPEPDYGWIAPGKRLSGTRASLVWRFKEKPSPEDARSHYRDGWLWNTMIVVARAGALWQLAESQHPEMTRRLCALRGWLGLPEEAQALELAYRSMPRLNFSRDLLERLPGWTAVLPMEGVRWSDWGRPERVEQTLSRIGQRSVLPPACGAPGEPQPALAAA